MRKTRPPAAGVLAEARVARVFDAAAGARKEAQAPVRVFGEAVAVDIGSLVKTGMLRTLRVYREVLDILFHEQVLAVG